MLNPAVIDLHTEYNRTATSENPEFTDSVTMLQTPCTTPALKDDRPPGTGFLSAYCTLGSLKKTEYPVLAGEGNKCGRRQTSG